MNSSAFKTTKNNSRHPHIAAKPKQKPGWRPEVGTLTREELRRIVADIVG